MYMCVYMYNYQVTLLYSRILMNTTTNIKYTMNTTNDSTNFVLILYELVHEYY